MFEDDVEELPKVASACIEAFSKKRKAEVEGKKLRKKARKYNIFQAELDDG